MLLAGNWAVTGKTAFPFRITYYNNNYGMVMSAEGYEAVTIVACVAGGIVGARNNVLTAELLKASGKAVWRIGRRTLKY